MTIKDVYAKYQIMPQLSLHMRRVAGVGKLILDGWKGEIDRDLVIRTLLLHDMGNIVKFDLSEAGQQKLKSAEVVDLPYWRKVQQEFWDKYGHDTHEVTKQINLELGQHDVIAVMEQELAGYAAGYPDRLMEQSWPAKILGYSDVRVTPVGVVPMKVRIEDLYARYGRELSWYDFLYELEERVKEMTVADLSTITEVAVATYFDEWLTYTI
jgi:hypothetical protein